MVCRTRMAAASVAWLFASLAVQAPATADSASGDRRASDGRSAFYRPTDSDAPPDADNYSVPEHSPPHCTLHFCVHWVESGEDAPDLSDADGNGIPDTVQRTADRFEAAWTREIAPPPTGLGWRPPKGDGSLGGATDKTDVYLENLHGYALGIARGDPGSAADGSGSGSGYILLERSLANAGRQAALTDIAAHELCHVLQVAYDPFASGWLMESTATWMQEVAFPSLDLWPRVMPRWVTNTESQMSEDSPTKSYGSAVWDHWLAGRYGPGIVREVWERSPHIEGSSLIALRVYDTVISARGGDGFHGEFTRFAAALPEWRVSSSGFADPSLLPEVERVATLAVDGAAIERPLRWDRFALLAVPGVQAHAIKLQARLPEGKRGGIALVGREGAPGSGTVTTRLLELPAGGYGDVTLARPGRFERVTAVLVSAHIGESEGGETASARIFSLPNGAPTASFVVVPDPPATGSLMALDASGSRDDDGRVTDYSWDLDGNGSFEIATGSQPTVAHRFRRTGPHTVRLRVSDDEGLQAETSRTFDVRDGTRPTVRLSVNRRQRTRTVFSGLRLRARSSERGRLTAELRLGARAAQRLGLRVRGRYAVLGRTHTAILRARSRRVTVRLNRAARRRVARVRRVALVLSVRVVDAAGNVGAANRGIVVTR